jgi:hypothetical protein
MTAVGVASTDAKLNRASISGQFDVLVTMDRNLRVQQSLHGVGLGIVVLQVKKQLPDDFLRLVPELLAAIAVVRNGEVRVIGP